MNEPRVLLCQLAVRTSKSGRSYMSGWLGRSKLVAFQAAQPDKWGNPCFDLYLQAVPEQREDDRPQLPMALDEAKRGSAATTVLRGRA